MNKKIVIGAFVICLLAFVAVMAFSQSSANVRWEYMTLNWGSSESGFVARANELGQQSWELVTANTSSSAFKRRLP